MIKIYTIENCEHCKKAKDILKKMNIPYEEYDLKKKENSEARKYYRSLGVKSAPIIIHLDINGIEDWVMTDFNENELKRKLGNMIPKIDEENIPSVDDEEEEDDDEEEKGTVIIKEDNTGYARCIHVSTLHTQVEITSNDPKNSLSDLKNMVESIIDKYKIE